MPVDVLRLTPTAIETPSDARQPQPETCEKLANGVELVSDFAIRTAGLDDPHVLPACRKRSQRVVEPACCTVHHVTSPPTQAVILSVTELCEDVHGFGVFGLTSYAQWMSVLSLSSASRDCTWALKRLFMSMSAFDADVNTCVSPPRTTLMIAITVIISTSE